MDEHKNRELTFGEHAVGLNFNPSNDPKVHRIKVLFAEIIDIANDDRGDRRDDGARHLSVGITDAETAQMRIVKGLTSPKKV